MEKVFVITHDGKPVGITRESEAMGGLSWFHFNCMAYSMEHALRWEGYGIAEGEPDCRDVAALVEGIAERIGLSAEFEFVPFSKSRNASPDWRDGKPWKSLNWRVTLKRGSRVVMVTDYGQGVSYCPAEKNAARWATKADQLQAIELEIEEGREATRFTSGSAPHISRKPIAPPRLGDVLESIAKDCDVLDAGKFEDWAESLGYDPDSRKAEAIWRQCLEVATALRGAIGGRALDELRLAAEFN